MRARVFLDEMDTRRFARGLVEVIDGFRVDGEKAAGRAIFGTHIRDRGAVRQREIVEAGAKELNEFPDHALLAQHLGDRQNQIGGGDALFQFADQFETGDLRQQHGLRLAEHGGFSLDAADAPTENRKAVDHGRVRIGADHRVREGDLNRDSLAARGLMLLLARPNGLREIFRVDLMANASSRRDDREIGERALAPLQECVALAVTGIFEVDVLLERALGTEVIDDHRMVDHQINGDQRIDLFGIAAQRRNAVAHRGEVDDRGNAGEVLHEHARGPESDLLLDLPSIFHPLGHAKDVVSRDGATIFVTQKIFEEHLHRIGKLADPFETVLLCRLQRIIMVRFRANLEGLAAFEAVERGHRCGVPGTEG